MAFARGLWLLDQISVRFGACFRPRSVFSTRPRLSSSLFVSGVVSLFLVMAFFSHNRADTAKVRRTAHVACGSRAALWRVKREIMIVVCTGN